MKTDRPIRSFLLRNVPALIAAVGLFILFYEAAYHLADSDYTVHSRWVMKMTGQDMLASFYNGSERLWHITVRLFFTCFIPDLRKAAAAVTALADAVAYFLVYRTFETAVTKKMPRWLLAVILLIPFIATSLTLPGQGLYAGRGALSTWHNPTNIMVRPFAAAVFYMTIRIYNRRRYGTHAIVVPLEGENTDFTFRGGFWAQFREPVYTWPELILYPLCLLLSVYSKPSFLQFFAPAIFIFLLIDVIRTKGMLLPFCIKLALSFIPAAFIILAAFKGFFPSGAVVAAASDQTSSTASNTAGIAVYFIKESFSDPGDFLQTAASNLKYFLLPCAFALFIFAAGAKNRSFRSLTLLSVICVCAAFLESWLLHETGSRAEHGNFLWGAYLASWLVWTAAAGEYSELITEKTIRGRIALFAGTTLLLWHLACGIVYVVEILRTGQYYI